MGKPSLKDLCQKGLGLDSAAGETLKAATRVILKERDNWFTEQTEHAEQGIYDFKTLHQLAAAYVEEGWNTATVQLSPGKRLWTSSDVGSDKHLYRHPQDKERYGRQSLI